MNAKVAAALADGGLPFLGGVFLLLFGYGRFTHPMPGVDPEEQYRRLAWARAFGPVLMAFGVFLFVRGLWS
jgi:hypothetical protein